jgi:hypothetical protein
MLSADAGSIREISIEIFPSWMEMVVRVDGRGVFLRGVETGPYAFSMQLRISKDYAFSMQVRIIPRLYVAGLGYVRIFSRSVWE